MTANQVEIFATPEAYEFLRDVADGQAVPMMKIINEMVSGNFKLSHIAGFGTSPLMTVQKRQDPLDPITVLLYKTRVNLKPASGVIVGAQLLAESNEYIRDIDFHLEDAICLNFV